MQVAMPLFVLKAKQVEVVPADTLLQQLRKKEDFAVIIRHKDFEGLPLIVKDQLELLTKNKKRGIYKAIHKQYSGTATFIPWEGYLNG